MSQDDLNMIVWLLFWPVGPKVEVCKLAVS